MGEDRKVVIEEKGGTQGCPDLFCNLIMTGLQMESSSTTAFSRKEAEETYNKLGEILNKQSKQIKLVRYMEEDGVDIDPEYFPTKAELDKRIDELSEKRIKEGGYAYIEGQDYDAYWEKK